MLLTPIQQIAVAALLKNSADRVNVPAASLARIEAQNKEALARIEQRNREIRFKSQAAEKPKYEWQTGPDESRNVWKASCNGTSKNAWKPR